MMPAPPTIVLATLNAKYIHAALGLRYLLANMGELKARTALCEFTLARPAEEIAEALLATLGDPASEAGTAHGSPQIIGFSVYIWNLRQTTAVLHLLRKRRPALKIVLGGPEVSHELDDQPIVALADHIITGWGDLSFARLCRALLGETPSLPKRIAGEQPPLDQIALPYAEYSDADLAHRLLYVEASRGCPFKCEFCLSALDRSAQAFDADRFLREMDRLFQRGARNFKFVDRTFNLKTEASLRLLQFFLDRLPQANNALFVHFEVIPDHLPQKLKALIAQFPPGVLQFEVGVQSFNSDVQQRIARRQDDALSVANLRWLLSASHAHVHADLIFGLPGETLASFAAGFDRLYALQPHEIQLGLLKRLRGAPIARHTEDYGMVYDTEPPYTVRQTDAVDAATLQRFVRFARYWDKIANAGRFAQTLPLLLGPPSPFAAFMDFSDWLWQSTGRTRDLAPEELVDLLDAYLCTQLGQPASEVRAALLADYVASGARGHPGALRGLLPRRPAPGDPARALAQRQARHRATRQRAD
jgi:hypothetical protein